MNLKYLGHSTFLIEFVGKSMIIDPFVSGNEANKTTKLDEIKVDYVLLTHGHMDHVLDAETIAKNNEATIISNYEIATWYGKKDLKNIGLNHGGKTKLDGFNVKYVHAVHSSVLPDGTYGGNPGGFVIWNESKSIYIAGDTALTMDMKLIPMFFPNLNAAILPIGDHFTMGYEEALVASDFIECDKIIGCHFDTFPPIAIDQELVKKAFEKKNKTIIIPEIGENITL